MSVKNSISIALTKKDSDIIEWLNMLQENQLNPATWVQAVLLAEVAGQDIDVGGVYVVAPKKKTASLGLFGDDTVQKQVSTIYGWHIRGFDGAYVPGSVFNITVTRPIIAYVIENYLCGRRTISRYMKAVLRKHIRRLPSLPNEPPKFLNVEDIFFLYERYFPKFDARKYGSQRKSISLHKVEHQIQTSDIVTDSEIKKDDSLFISSPSLNMSVPKKNPLLEYIS